MVTLYRFFDCEDVLLYVGISQHPLARLDWHANGQAWWHLVRRASFEQLPTRDAALAAEAAAIREERPIYNVRGVEDPADLPDHVAAYELRLDMRAREAHRRLGLGDRL